MKKFIIHNLGCKVNFAEISQIKQLLESNGYQHIVLNSTNLIETETPNFIFIHTCTVTDKADSDGRRLIRKYHKLFPYAKIVVLGCYAEIAYNELYEIEGVYKIYGNIDKFKILQNLENDTNTNIKNYKSNLCENTFYYADSAENEAHTRISMKIQDGCDYFCSYCAIPYSRGANRSMNFEDFKTQFKNIYHKGAKEVILSGINLGCYSGDSNDSNTKKYITINKLSEIVVAAMMSLGTLKASDSATKFTPPPI